VLCVCACVVYVCCGERSIHYLRFFFFFQHENVGRMGGKAVDVKVLSREPTNKGAETRPHHDHPPYPPKAFYFFSE
jgi:hypothetical protein